MGNSSPTMETIEKSARRWFYLLTYSCIMVTAAIGVVGIRLLFKLKATLSFPQLALAAAIVFGLVLLAVIFTVLIMLFYHPRRRRN